MEKKEKRFSGLFKTISMGIKVLLSEIYWVILKGLRKWEIYDLKKRLNNEYAEFGRLTFHDPQNKKEIKVCTEQIEFLKNEIEFLENEIKRIREDILKKRKEIIAVS